MSIESPEANVVFEGPEVKVTGHRLGSEVISNCLGLTATVWASEHFHTDYPTKGIQRVNHSAILHPPHRIHTHTHIFMYCTICLPTLGVPASGAGV